MYIDTHCHLDSKDYDNVEDVIKRVENNILIVSGVDDRTNKEVVALCNKYKNIYKYILLLLLQFRVFSDIFYSLFY